MAMLYDLSSIHQVRCTYSTYRDGRPGETVTDLTGSLLNRCPYRREDNIMTTHLMAFVKWTHILGRNKGLGAEKQNQRVLVELELPQQIGSGSDPALARNISEVPVTSKGINYNAMYIPSPDILIHM